MAQLVRTTNDVIVNSLYLLGELGVTETPDAFMLTTGLEIINELLDKFSLDSIYIPYLKTITFNFVAGQGEYTISDMVASNVSSNRIVDLDLANYNVPTNGSTTLSYQLTIVNEAQFFMQLRQNNLTTRPGFIFLRKAVNQSVVRIYPIPDQAYTCELRVKLMLNSLGAQDDLSQLEPYYYGFLKYALARKFLAYYPSGNWPQMNEDEYQDYYNGLKNANPTDMTIKPSVILTWPYPLYVPNLLVY